MPPPRSIDHFLAKKNKQITSQVHNPVAANDETDDGSTDAAAAQDESIVYAMWKSGDVDPPHIDGYGTVCIIDPILFRVLFFSSSSFPSLFFCFFLCVSASFFPRMRSQSIFSH